MALLRIQGLPKNLQDHNHQTPAAIDTHMKNLNADNSDVINEY